MILESRTRPLVVAHRGASAHAPGNTLEAFRLAVDQGADGVELDVRATADGAMIVHHDPGVHDFGVFAQRTLAELRAAFPLVPTLDEVAEVVGDLLINVEIKNDPRQPDHDPTQRLAETIAAWVDSGGRHDQVLVSSFNARTVDAVRAADERIATGQLLDRLTDLRRQTAAAAERGHAWVIPHKSHIGRDGLERVAEAHELDVLVAVWTVDSRRRLRHMAAAGVDAVITNDPRKAVALYSAG